MVSKYDNFYKALCVVLLFLLAISFSIHRIEVYKEDNNIVRGKTIPPVKDTACMARYIVHSSNWCSLSYISNQNNSKDYPMSRVFSISDGSLNDSTGDVYFMVAPIDLTVKDLMVNNRCSIIVTLAEEDFCNVMKYDSQDPRCGQAVLTGEFNKLAKHSPEWKAAKKALFDRHPVMKYWYYIMLDHAFFFARMVIKSIYVVDTFGGRQFPLVNDYYNATSCLHKYAISV